MRSEFKHPRIYANVVALYEFYWPLHQNLPQGVRNTTGEQILTELTQSLRTVISVNLVDKDCEQARQRAVAYLADVRASMEIIRVMLTLCWQLKWLSRGALALLTARISLVLRQIARWQRWFLAPTFNVPVLSNLKPET